MGLVLPRFGMVPTVADAFVAFATPPAKMEGGVAVAESCSDNRLPPRVEPRGDDSAHQARQKDEQAVARALKLIKIRCSGKHGTPAINRSFLQTVVDSPIIHRC